MRNHKTACFEGLVLEPHIAQILRPLLATLLPPLSADFAASIILLEDAKSEMAGLSNTCVLVAQVKWTGLWPKRSISVSTFQTLVQHRAKVRNAA